MAEETSETQSTPTIKPPRHHAECTLIKIDLDDSAQRHHFKKQRIECGWHHADDEIEAWHQMMLTSKMSMFWIVRGAITPLPSYSDETCIGHIALEYEEDDAELATPDRSIIMLTNLFIMPAHRGGGLGRAAVVKMEDMAQHAPYGSEKCEFVTITTISRKYNEDAALRKQYESWGFPLALGYNNEDWYLNMGYVKFNEMPRYTLKSQQGGDVTLDAVYMRKAMGAHSSGKS